jgi:hypothetical protein
MILTRENLGDLGLTVAEADADAATWTWYPPGRYWYRYTAAGGVDVTRVDPHLTPDARAALMAQEQAKFEAAMADKAKTAAAFQAAQAADRAANPVIAPKGFDPVTGQPLPGLTLAQAQAMANPEAAAIATAANAAALARASAAIPTFMGEFSAGARGQQSADAMLTNMYLAAGYQEVTLNSGDGWYTTTQSTGLGFTEPGFRAWLQTPDGQAAMQKVQAIPGLQPLGTPISQIGQISGADPQRSGGFFSSLISDSPFALLNPTSEPIKNLVQSVKDPDLLKAAAIIVAAGVGAAGAAGWIGAADVALPTAESLAVSDIGVGVSASSGGVLFPETAAAFDAAGAAAGTAESFAVAPTVELASTALPSWVTPEVLIDSPFSTEYFVTARDAILAATGGSLTGGELISGAKTALSVANTIKGVLGVVTAIAGAVTGKGAGSTINPATGLPRSAGTQTPVRINPETGQPFPIDARTGRPYDPRTGLPVDDAGTSADTVSDALPWLILGGALLIATVRR